MTPDQLERFVELDDAGRSAPQIASDLGVSTRTVERWRAQMGRRKAPPMLRRPDSDRERARVLADDGCSIAEIARTLGVCWQTAARWVPDAHRYTKTEAGEMAALHRYELRMLKHLRHESRNTWSESVEPHAPTDAHRTTSTKRPEHASTSTGADASHVLRGAGSTS